MDRLNLPHSQPQPRAGAGSLWNRIRKPCIAGIVLFHFVAGLLCLTKESSALLKIPGISELTGLYERFAVAQTWHMFAPPPECHLEISYSLKLKDGWTSLRSMDDYLRERSAGQTFLPRGFMRVATHLRHPLLKNKPLKEQIYFYSYFQELSAYFLFGNGAVPEVEAVRFYSVIKGIAPFYATDAQGHARPKAEDFDRIEPLYERKITDR